MTIEAGLAVTILLSIMACTKWLSSALATVTAKLEAVHDKQVEQKADTSKLELVMSNHGERLASLEARRSFGDHRDTA